MIVLDANLLIYAYDIQAAQHSPAREWLETKFSESETIALPWEAVTAFLRITTQGGPLKAPFTMQHAIGIVESWLQQPQVLFLFPNGTTWIALKRLLLESNVSGRSVTDAQFAAAAVAQNAALYSGDYGFKRFRNLDWKNPLAV